LKAFNLLIFKGMGRPILLFQKQMVFELLNRVSAFTANMVKAVRGCRIPGESVYIPKKQFNEESNCCVRRQNLEGSPSGESRWQIEPIENDLGFCLFIG
jgi:hypothetical protein